MKLPTPKLSLITKTVALCSTLFFSQLAAAQGCTQNNNTVGFVGMDGKVGDSGMVFVSLSGHNNGCEASYVRFKASETDVDMALSILLAARMADKKVRIDLKDKNDKNSAYRVYIH